MNEAISIGLLVVNNDVACQKKVAQVLRCCNYEGTNRKQEEASSFSFEVAYITCLRVI